MRRRRFFSLVSAAGGRIKPRLFTIASAVSLLACASVLALIVFDHSYRIPWKMGSRARAAAVWMRGNGGELNLFVNTDFKVPPYFEGSLQSAEFNAFEKARPPLGGHYAGFGWQVEHRLSQDMTFHQGRKRRIIDEGMFYLTWMPGWFLVWTTGILPAIWIWSRVRSRRRKGHCAKCGYNLTGNTSGVCPECGTPVAEMAQAKA